MFDSVKYWHQSKHSGWYTKRTCGVADNVQLTLHDNHLQCSVPQRIVNCNVSTACITFNKIYLSTFKIDVYTEICCTVRITQYDKPPTPHVVVHWRVLAYSFSLKLLSWQGRCIPVARMIDWYMNHCGQVVALQKIACSQFELALYFSQFSGIRVLA